MGHLDEVIHLANQLRRVPAHHGQDTAAPRFHFLDVGNDFCVDGISGSERDHGHIVVDEGDRAVFHLGRRVSLGVDVTHFLKFERPLERHRKLVSTPQVKEVLSISIRRREFLRKGPQRQRLRYLIR